MTVLEVTDDRFDGGAAFHEAFDGRGNAAFLPRCEDAQFVYAGRIVAPVSGIGEDAFKGGAGERLDLRDYRCQGVAVVWPPRQRLGVDRELAALAALEGGGDRGLDAELIGLVALALADAFHLRRVQG